MAQREGCSGDKPAAAYGDEDHRIVGCVGRFAILLRHFEADRRLAGDDQRIVERRDKHRAVLRRVDTRQSEAVVDARTTEDHLGAITLRRLELGERDRFGHEDHRTTTGER